ncbi:MAG: dUTP diphosphatase [Coriobacteriaceae bacterium]|nr:dUTP diphosphatase [Coriobacteriaceae bacterium]
MPESEHLYVPLKKLDDAAVVPANAYRGDAGVDLHALEGCTLEPFERRLIHTGLAIAIPEGYAGFVMPRSGSALKKGLSLVNTPGLIDSNYRGELGVIAVNLDAHEPIVIEPGDRVAQLVLMKVENVAFKVVHDLDDTDRGAGGFGSSGFSKK